MAIQAWRELRSLRNPERFGVWLYRLLVNACYEESRRHRRWSIHIRALPVDGPSVADTTITVDDRDALDRAFERLTPEHRIVVVLHHYVGIPLTEIADVVGVDGIGYVANGDLVYVETVLESFQAP